MTLTVGNAPWMNIHKRVIRAEPNPLDVATIVSIFPLPIVQKNPTIQPGIFEIPAGRIKSPGILVVGTSSWWRDLDESQPALEIPQSSVVVAASIITDWCNGLHGYSPGDMMPGLFYVPGKYSQLDILEKNKNELALAEQRQTKWFKELVKFADILWSRSNGNPLSISDTARLAAQELQLKDKPWLKDFQTMELTNCPACGSLRKSEYPVCQHCKTIVDPAKYKSLGLQMAQ